MRRDWNRGTRASVVIVSGRYRTARRRGLLTPGQVLAHRRGSGGLDRIARRFLGLVALTSIDERVCTVAVASRGGLLGHADQARAIVVTAQAFVGSQCLVSHWTTGWAAILRAPGDLRRVVVRRGLCVSMLRYGSYDDC